MLPLMINVLPNNMSAGTPPPLPQALPPVVPVDAVTAARQQLPVAVVASGTVPFTVNNSPQPKVAARPITSTPSSALAAQVINQTPAPTEAELEIFAASAPRPQEKTQQENAADDYLQDMRIARGDYETSATESATPRTASTAPAPQTASTSASTASSAANLNAAATAVLANPKAIPLTSRPAVLPFVPMGRKPSVAQVRGLAAYQLAENRNASMNNPESATKIL